MRDQPACSRSIVQVRCYELRRPLGYESMFISRDVAPRAGRPAGHCSGNAGGSGGELGGFEASRHPHIYMSVMMSVMARNHSGRALPRRQSRGSTRPWAPTPSASVAERTSRFAYGTTPIPSAHINSSRFRTARRHPAPRRLDARRKAPLRARPLEHREGNVEPHLRNENSIRLMQRRHSARFDRARLRLHEAASRAQSPRQIARRRMISLKDAAWEER